MKNFKRVVAALLVVVMIFAMAPVAAFADDTVDAPWIQLESVKDPETGKSTLTVKLNADKIKKGDISGLELNEIFRAVLGDKNVANSGLISMKDLLNIFPIIYEVDDTGKAVASGDSVLDVVGATAIIGLTTIVEEYVDDLGALITANKETLKNEIKIANILNAVSGNATLRNILAGYFDTAEERDLYMTEAGKTALAGIAGKTREEVFAEFTASDYRDFFNKGYLNFEAIVSGLMNDVLDAIAKSTYPNVSDYLTANGLACVETKKFDIMKYLLENDQVTIQELSEHLNITVDNVNNLFVDGVVQDEKTYNERTNLANEIVKALFGTTYIKSGKELELAEAIRAGADLWALSSYLNLNALLETGFGYSKDDVMVKAIDNTSGLVLTGHSASVLALIKDSTSTVEDFVPHVDVEKMVSALDITKDQVKEKIGMPGPSDPGIVTNWPAVLALGDSAPVSDYLPYLNVAKLLAAIYGDDATAKNTVALQILTASSLVKEGSEAAVLTLVQSSTSKIEDFTDYIQVSSVLSALGISYVDIYAKLLEGSSVIKEGKNVEAATILDNNKSDFSALVSAAMAEGSPLVDNALVTLVQNFVTGIETGSDESRKKAFEKTIKPKIEESPATYIKDDGVNELFGSRLIYYFFRHVDATTGKIDGESMDYYLDLDKVIALLDVELTAGSTLKAKIISEAGYENYLTQAGKDFVNSKVINGTAGKELEELYSDYTTYFDTDALFAALVVDSDFTDIVFADPQKYVTVKGMNTILQYWLTEEGLDSKDMTGIIDTLKNAEKKEYATTNGEMVYYNGNKLLRNAVIQGINKFFTNAVDIVVNGKDIADTEPYPNRHLLLDGTALMERIYNVLLPTVDELDNIGSDGYLKTFNVVVRAQNDYYYWEENSSSVKVPPQDPDTGDLEYITLDVDVKLYLTGDISGLKKQIAQHKDKIKSDFDFEYLYDYTYGIYKDGGTLPILVAADTYLDLAYSALTAEQKMRVNRYNKVGLVKGADEINVSFDLPYFLTFVYRNLAESDLDSAIKEKLYDFVYNKTISDLTSANRFTVAELYAMIDALDLDALMEEFSNDPRGREWLMLIFDFIGDEDLIMDWYENGKPTASVKDSAGNDSYYVDPDWTAANGWYVTAEWVWQALTHWKDLEQAAVSRGQDIKGIAALLDTLQNNQLFNKLLDRVGREPIDFSAMVDADFHLPVGDFLGDVTIALDTSANTLEAAFKNPAKSFKDVLKAFVQDEYSNIQKGLNKIFDKMPSSIIDSPIKDFYMGSSLFKTEPSNPSKNTYTTLNEYKLINTNIKKVLASAWSDLTDDEVAGLVDGFVGNLQSARQVNVSAKQNGLYKVTFYGLDGTTELLTTFLPEGTDPAKAYQDTEVKTGYVFDHWLDAPTGTKVPTIPGADISLYAGYIPDLTINYNLNVSYEAPSGDSTVVSGSMTTPVAYHYNEDVTIAATGFTEGYELDYIEYKLPGETSYTLYTGASFSMPMGDVDVKIVLKKSNFGISLNVIPPIGTSATATLTNGTTYAYGSSVTLGVSSISTGFKLDHIEYKLPGDAEYTVGTSFTMPAGTVDVNIYLDYINYNLVVTYVTDDSSDVTGSLVGGTVYHYQDTVVLAVTGLTDSNYTLDYFEYKFPTAESFTTGANFTMPAGNVTVVVHLTKASVDFTPTLPAGIEGTVGPANAGDPIPMVITTPGYEVDKVTYDGVDYTPDPTDGNKLKDADGNELVAKPGVPDITLQVKKSVYTLNVAEVSSLNGAPVSATLTCTTSYNYQDSVTLTAGTFSTGYELDHFEYSVDGGANYVIGNTFTMPTNNVSVKIILKQINYTLTVAGVSSTDSAAVAATLTNAATYHYNDAIALAATGFSTGYELDHFEYSADGGVSYTTGASFTMPAGNVLVKIVLKPINYTLTVAEVSSTDSAAVAATLTNAATYHYNDAVALVATGFTTGYELDHFEYSIDGGVSYTTGASFTMPAGNVKVKIVLKQADYTLTVAGVSSTDSAAVAATLTNAATYHYNDAVALAATGFSTGYELDHFEYSTNGGVSYTTGANFTMPAGNVLIKIVLKPINYTLTVAGVSSTDSAAVAATLTCPTNYSYGSAVTLTAANFTVGYELDHFEYSVDGGVSYTTGASFTMPAGNVKVKIVLKKTDYTLTLVGVSSTDSATVTATLSCSMGYNYGDAVTLTATGFTAGYELDHFEYSTDGGANYTTGANFTMPAGNVKVKIVLRQVSYTLTVVEVSSIDSAAVTATLTNAATYHYNDAVALVATGFTTGYELDHFEYSIDGGVSYTTGASFTMPTSNVKVKIVLRKATYTLSLSSVTSVNNATVTATLTNPTSYLYQDPVTLTATDFSTGYELDHFEYSTNGGVSYTTGANFTMPAGNVLVKIVLKRTIYTVSASFVSNDATPVTGIFTGGTAHYYGDTVSITSTGYTTDYQFDFAEYKFASASAYTVGTSFTMPAENVDVIIHLKKATITFNPTLPAGIGGTVSPADPGDPINITITTPGYEVDKVTYDGVDYTPDPTDGNKLKDAYGNEMVAKDGVADITITVKQSNYVLNLVDVTSVGGESVTAVLACPLTYHYNNSVILIAGSMTTGYEVDHFEYKQTSESAYTSILPGNSFDMPLSNVDVRIVLKQTDYTLTVAGVSSTDSTAVAATLTNAATYHYNDAVALVATGFTTGYELDHFEYSTNGGVSYTTGANFTMPAGNVLVKIVLKPITYTLTVAEVSSTDSAAVAATLTCPTNYPYGSAVTLTAASLTAGYELDHFEYSTDGGVSYTTGANFTMPAGNVLVKIVLKPSIYCLNLVSVDADDFALVAASLVTSSYYFGDSVTLAATGITTNYTVASFEYKLPGAIGYTTGTSFTMPAGNVDVKIHLTKINVAFTPTLPAGISGTITGKAGEPIVITITTPGYEVNTVTYGGTDYTFNPVTGKYEDVGGNELIADPAVTAINVTVKPIHYTITVTYAAAGVTGDLVSMTDKTVEDTITLAVSSLNTTAYKVSYITYRLAGATAETVYSGPFKMLPGNLVVTVYLTETSVPTPSAPSYKIDDIEVTGDVVDGDDKVDATVSFDKPSYKPGQVVIVTVDDIEEGYELDYIAVVKDGEETPLDGTYFIMPDGKVGIKVYTKRKTYEYSIAGVPDTGLYKDTISFTVTVGKGEVMKEIPEGCVLVSAKVGPNGEMELTYVFSLTENGKDVNYRIGDLSYRTLKIKNGVEWVDANDPTGENGSAFKGWSALVGETYLFASFEKTAKLNLWWLWIILILLILIALEVIFYRKDEKDGREKGGLWKVVRAIGDAFIALSRAFYGLFHRKNA